MKECAHADGCSSRNREFIDFCMAEGLLSERVAKEKRIPDRQSTVPSLRYLELQITDRCNLKCRHCYIGKGDSHELPLKAVRGVM